MYLHKYFSGRDRVPFVLTSDMAFVINDGGRRRDRFQRFVDLCCKAFNILRKHADLFHSLFVMVSASDDIKNSSVFVDLKKTDFSFTNAIPLCVKLTKPRQEVSSGDDLANHCQGFLILAKSEQKHSEQQISVSNRRAVPNGNNKDCTIILLWIFYTTYFTVKGIFVIFSVFIWVRSKFLYRIGKEIKAKSVYISDIYWLKNPVSLHFVQNKPP